MADKTNQKGFRPWTLFLVCGLTCLLFAQIPAGKAEGGDSPQAVFKAAQAAGAKKDFGALAGLVAPTEHAMLAFSTDMAVGMLVEFYEGEKAAELKKKYEQIQKKYEVKIKNENEDEKLHITNETPQEVIDEHIRKRAKKFYGHVDAVKYVPDLMGIIINMPEMAEQSFFPQEELSDLKIEGDSATGKAGEKSISFIREGDRWYLTADVIN
ncbi:hypothetical protein JW906_12150 [bacterium]|nr:hypothetical protein [bacterium]